MLANNYDQQEKLLKEGVWKDQPGEHCSAFFLG